MAKPTVQTLENLPVAILAGGLATRLRPITTQVPKSMVPVAGRPFVDHQLTLLRENGIRRVVFCLGHLGEQLRDHVGDGSKFGIEATYSLDGPKLLGTGGAIRQALPLLGDAFWVLYGDSYLDVEYPAILERFRSSNALALMTVLANQNRWDRSNVLFQDGKLKFYSKKMPHPDMAHIDYGLGLFHREAVERIPANQNFDLADLYSALVEEKRMVGFEVSKRFYEIGSPAGLVETEMYLKARAA